MFLLRKEHDVRVAFLTLAMLMTNLLVIGESLRAQVDQLPEEELRARLSGQVSEGSANKEKERNSEDVEEKSDGTETQDKIVGKVGKQPIRWSDVKYRWKSTSIEAIPQLESIDPVLLRESITTIAQQRIAMAELDRRKLGVTNAEVDQWIKQRVTAIEGASVNADDLAAREGLPLSQWRQELRWQMSWQRYLKDRINEERLKEHFESHRERFDGTELEVFHVLIKCEANQLTQRQEARNRLAEFREKIADGEMTFEEVAQSTSQGATAKEGGRLGWLAYEGAMPRPFIRAAFDLKEGEVSQPVETVFGVHLIWVKSIQKGQKDFGRSIAAVRRSLLEQLFEEVVQSYPNPPEISYGE
jgi:peptidyl-prolyl cis-trans isomerase SurA